MGELYLYDITESNYAKIKIFDSEYNLHNTAGAVISTIASSGVAFYPNAYNGFLYVPNTITASRQYEFPNKSGVVALISDVPSPPAYRVYTALLTQNGTTAPVATVLENTIGVMSLEYSNPGTYYITSVEFNGFADYGKVAVLLTNGGSGYFTSAQYVPSINGITIRTVNNLNIATNDLMSGTTIEIRLYN
jgi:hypothetical protein